MENKNIGFIDKIDDQLKKREEVNSDFEIWKYLDQETVLKKINLN